MNISTPEGPRAHAKKAAYTGSDLSAFATIERDKCTKAASIIIRQPGEWRLYAGTCVDEINFDAPLLSSSSPGVYPLDVPGDVRTYFQLETDAGTAILAERHLPMAGGFNFRDLGGIRTTDGRYTRWGKILRSDGLNQLTDVDLTYLASIPVVSVVDFRSDEEMTLVPDKMPTKSTIHYPYTISPGNLAASLRDMSGTMRIENVMAEINVMLVSDAAVIGRYRDLFALLQNPQDTPLLFHCSAGKDRTGMGAALILYALGVDDERIMADYLLSNKYILPKYADQVERRPEMRPFFEVQRKYITAGIDRIKADHGTVQNYLTKVLEVDIERFRELYLYE